MRKAAVVLGFLAAALMAQPSMAAPRDNGAIAEFKRLCVDTHAATAAVAVAAKKAGWKLQPNPSGVPAMETPAWTRSDAHGGYRLAVGNYPLVTDLRPIRTCALSIKPGLGDAPGAVRAWLPKLTPKVVGADTSYFFTQQGAVQTSLPAGDVAAGRAAITDGTLRAVTVKPVPGETQLGYFTAEYPSN
jgi:hypothetical protein